MKIIVFFVKFIRFFNKNAFKKYFWTKEEIEKIKKEVKEEMLRILEECYEK